MDMYTQQYTHMYTHLDFERGEDGRVVGDGDLVAIPRARLAGQTPRAGRRAPQHAVTPRGHARLLAVVLSPRRDGGTLLPHGDRGAACCGRAACCGCAGGARQVGRGRGALPRARRQLVRASVGLVEQRRRLGSLLAVLSSRPRL
eukprot:scaffold78413_cov67-Phaeocystis_antarctica.AAC.5